MASYTHAIGAHATAPSLTLTGTNGRGFTLTHLASPPPAPSPSTSNIYTTSGGLVWDHPGSTATITPASGANSYALPSTPGTDTLVTAGSSSTFTNKTIPHGAGNAVSASALLGAPLYGTPTAGNLLVYSGLLSGWQPTPLTATAPLSYTPSTSTLSIPVGTTSGTVAAGDDPRHTYPQTRTVKTPAGAGQYTTLAAALSSITDSSNSKPYTVHVHPGIYAEPNLVVPPYTSVVGPATITPSTSGVLFTLSQGATLHALTILGPDTAIVPGTDSTLREISITDAGVPISSTASGVTIQHIVISGAYTTGISLVGGSALISDVHYTGYSSPDTRTCVSITSFADITFSALVVDPSPGATAVSVASGAIVVFQEPTISGVLTAFNVLAASPAAHLDISAGTLISNTNDLIIQNSATTGGYTGTIDISKISFGGSDYTVFGLDRAGGQLSIGDFTYARHPGLTPTDHGDAIANSMPLGVISGGDVTPTTGTGIQVSAGIGYISAGTYPNSNMQKIIWAATTITLPPASVSYIYATSSGVTSGLSAPDILTTVYLARVATTASALEFIDRQPCSAVHPSTYTLKMLRKTVGPLYHSGSIVTVNGSRQIAITAGKYYFGSNEINTVGAVSPASYVAYYHAPALTRVSQSILDQQYDTGSGLAPLPAGKYTKHTLYIAGYGSSESYLLIYGDAAYDTLSAAESAMNPMPPTYFTDGVVIIAGLVVLQGSNAVVVIDLRPRITTGNGTVASVSDHGDLTGLGDDDHTQYLLTDGTRAMSGDLNLAGHNLTSTGTINGISIASHAAGHVPGGTDPIPTAAAVGLSSASTNTAGTAATLARSDHTHAVSLSGYTINTLSGVADVPHGGTGVGTHTSGCFLVGAGTGAITSTKTVPSGDVVGTTDTQTLIGKTIATGTNSVLVTAASSTSLNSLMNQAVNTTSAPTFASLTLTGGISMFGRVTTYSGAVTTTSSAALTLYTIPIPTASCGIITTNVWSYVTAGPNTGLGTARIMSTKIVNAGGTIVPSTIQNISSTSGITNTFSHIPLGSLLIVAYGGQNGATHVARAVSILYL